MGKLAFGSLADFPKCHEAETGAGAYGQRSDAALDLQELTLQLPRASHRDKPGDDLHVTPHCTGAARARGLVTEDSGLSLGDAPKTSQNDDMRQGSAN